MQHPGKTISIYEVAFCVGQAYLESMLPADRPIAEEHEHEAGHSFSQTTPDVDFLPTHVADRPIAEEHEHEAGHSFSQTTPRTLANEVTPLNIKQLVSPEV
ncbi:hypothetical protein QE152_g30517 [Popillia japonica]|uniref:Uncharacterized protein n=1 Tax=Popillia japonica TaxID=7064 RepID=A0AAW1JFF7_POPJA